MLNLKQIRHDANVKALASNVYRSAVAAYEWAVDHGAEDRTEACILAAYARDLAALIRTLKSWQRQLLHAIAENGDASAVIMQDYQVEDAINLEWYEPFPERTEEIQTLEDFLLHVSRRRGQPVNEKTLAHETGVTPRTFRLIVEGEVEPPDGFEGGLTLALQLRLSEICELRDILHPNERGEIRLNRFGDDWELAPDELSIPEGTDETT